LHMDGAASCLRIYRRAVKQTLSEHRPALWNGIAATLASG